MHKDMLYVQGDTVAGSKRGCGRREQRMMKTAFHILSVDRSSDMPYLTTAMPPCICHVPHQDHQQLNMCVVLCN